MKKLYTILALAFSFNAMGSDIATSANSSAVTNIYADKESGEITINLITESTSTITINDSYEVAAHEEGIAFSIKGYVTAIGSGEKSIIFKGQSKYTAVVINASKLQKINANAFSGFTAVESLTLNTETPATIEAGAFPTEWATNCALTVPEGSFDAYKAAWGKYFKSINGVAMDENTPTKTPGWDVPYITARPMGRSIKLSETADVQVYSITGASVYNGKTDVIDVEKGGIYIVKTKDNTTKVTVK